MQPVQEWVVPEDVQVPEALPAAVGGHPLVAAALVRRGISEPQAALAFLNPDHYCPAPASQLPGIQPAADRVETAIRRRELICVWGDFDVDGQTATALLVTTLRDLGAHVIYHIPLRGDESHGINLPALQKIISGGARLILTCDTGISAHQAVEYARRAGVDVVITDHHDLPPALPQARAVVNPRLLPEHHPLYHLPGVGTAYKLAEALYERAGQPQAAHSHLDLVALGIVADVATQVGDTRYLLQRGLAALRQTRRPGLRALMEAADLDPTHLSEEHIGYVLGPRLNAVGRLADASLAVELLTTADLTRSRVLASQMEGLNARRRLLCAQVERAALAQIERDPSLLDQPALVLTGPAWPAGIIGIVAGRLAERYGRPVVLISAPPGEVARGSARSVEGCNISAALASVSELLLTFGGHPMAAGFSIHPDRIPDFHHALLRAIRAMGVTRPGARPGMRIDAVLPLHELSLELVEDLGRLAPFGPGNPPLVLMAPEVRVAGQRLVGRHQEHRLITLADASGLTYQAIWWEAADEPLPEGEVDLAYQARASDYRGQRGLQIEWIAARPARGAPAIEVAARPPVAVEDWRAAENPQAILDEVRRHGTAAIWCEGPQAGTIGGHGRYSLPAAEELLIWSAPPGPAELRAALAQVNPLKVYLVGLDPGLDQPEMFLRRLAGLVKHAIRAHGGRVAVGVLAEATAQREETVWCGLQWLAGHGDIRLRGVEAGMVALEAGEAMGNQSAELESIGKRLEALLAETAAYRAYFRRADSAALIYPSLPV